jgi:hypothetical protein
LGRITYKICGAAGVEQQTGPNMAVVTALDLHICDALTHKCRLLAIEGNQHSTVELVVQATTNKNTIVATNRRPDTVMLLLTHDTRRKHSMHTSIPDASLPCAPEIQSDDSSNHDCTTETEYTDYGKPQCASRPHPWLPIQAQYRVSFTNQLRIVADPRNK